MQRIFNNFFFFQYSSRCSKFCYLKCLFIDSVKTGLKTIYSRSHQSVLESPRDMWSTVVNVNAKYHKTRKLCRDWWWILFFTILKVKRRKRRGDQIVCWNKIDSLESGNYLSIIGYSERRRRRCRSIQELGSATGASRCIIPQRLNSINL